MSESPDNNARKEKFADAARANLDDMKGVIFWGKSIFVYNVTTVFGLKKKSLKFLLVYRREVFEEI